MSNRSALVKDYMSRKVVTFEVNDNVGDVVSVLLENQLSGAPVLDADRHVIGFVSEQDCIKEMLNTAFYCDLTANAGDVMSSPVTTVPSDMAISDLAQWFDTAKPKVYPVVDGGRVVGVIERTQVLRALYEQSQDCHHLSNQSAAM